MNFYLVDVYQSLRVVGCFPDPARSATNESLNNGSLSSAEFGVEWKEFECGGDRATVVVKAGRYVMGESEWVSFQSVLQSGNSIKRQIVLITFRSCLPLP